MHKVASGIAILVTMGIPGLASADYAAAGPLPFATSDLPSGAGGASGGNLVVPTGAGPYPLLVTSHGFSANASNQLGWAEHFASYGFVVVVPSFAGGVSPDHAKNGDTIAALVTLYANPATTSPARGKVDGARVGLEGHSAGGLATTLAASKMKPQAVVLFDPVDANNLGKTALASVCTPLLGIFAGPSTCNSSAGWSAFRATSVGPQIIFDVVGSTHCDGENSPRGLCGPFCGGAANPTRQSAYARYATAFFLSTLTGDATAAAAIAQAKLVADTALANVSVRPAPTCTPPVPPPDAGVSDAGAVADGGARPDGGGTGGPTSDGGARGDAGAERDGGATGPGDDDAGSGGGGGASGGCAVGGTRTPRPLFAALLASVGLALARRRRRRAR